jgi:hypothetical protein
MIFQNLVIISLCYYYYSAFNIKVSPQQAVETHKVVRRRGSHIVYYSRLTDGGEVVSLKHLPPFTPRMIPSFSNLLFCVSKFLSLFTNFALVLSLYACSSSSCCRSHSLRTCTVLTQRSAGLLIV